MRQFVQQKSNRQQHTDNCYYVAVTRNDFVDRLLFCPGREEAEY